MSSWDDDDPAAPSAAEAATTDVELLKRVWRNEKAAPEVLGFDSPLVSRVREQIQLLEETLDDFADSGVDDLVVSLYQMDLDRTLFLLRSYLRLRLQKIEKYTMHISRSDDLLSRLSPQERRFAKSGEEVVDLVADDLYVLRYKSIKGLVEGGRIDLI
ncbi:hypothetical protein BAE44_0007326 [Dichanthelium oligosanthes]|uniref:GINS subunit domain-containing protein n=1 Tax=Dichanthelium oligosanthes TaxID=888268 RepID=A0A1E5W2P0_9POAL|nr:hypothetical protein BAE44_0007326 [Dichanthelium oligosanthes]